MLTVIEEGVRASLRYDFAQGDDPRYFKDGDVHFWQPENMLLLWVGFFHGAKDGKWH